MLFQIALGSVLMMATVAIAGLTTWALEMALDSSGGWLRRWRPRVRVTVGIMVMTLWALAAITAQVWLWAVVLQYLGAFTDREEAIYYTLVTFTTLGYGDVLLPKGLRVLGALAAVNGMLNIGVLTAVMIDSIRVLRQKYGIRAP